MKHLLLTLALLAPLALAACDNKSEDTTTTGSIEAPASMEPAAGDEATAATTDSAEPTTTSDSMTTTTPSGDTVTTTTTTTTEAAAEGVAAGEPNPATPAANSCGDHSAWIGKKKADIQTELDAMGDKVRVLYPDSAATMDYNAERVNVILEKDTDVVTEVRCG